MLRSPLFFLIFLGAVGCHHPSRPESTAALPQVSLSVLAQEKAKIWGLWLEEGLALQLRSTAGVTRCLCHLRTAPVLRGQENGDLVALQPKQGEPLPQTGPLFGRVEKDFSFTHHQGLYGARVIEGKLQFSDVNSKPAGGVYVRATQTEAIAAYVQAMSCFERSMAQFFEKEIPRDPAELENVAFVAKDFLANRSEFRISDKAQLKNSVGAIVALAAGALGLKMFPNLGALDGVKTKAELIKALRADRYLLARKFAGVAVSALVASLVGYQVLSEERRIFRYTFHPDQEGTVGQMVVMNDADFATDIHQNPDHAQDLIQLAHKYFEREL